VALLHDAVTSTSRCRAQCVIAAQCPLPNISDHRARADPRSLDVYGPAYAHGKMAAHIAHRPDKRTSSFVYRGNPGSDQHEVTHLARDLNRARAAAEEEARLRDSNASLWTARAPARQPAKQNCRKSRSCGFESRALHARFKRKKTNRLTSSFPPVAWSRRSNLFGRLRRTWIANGSGNADREVTDASDRLRVPQTIRVYTLRRVWLSDEEDKGYYEGFSNEGLWPLCHIAHTRPSSGPRTGCSIRKSIAALPTPFAGNGGTESPIVLAQDLPPCIASRMIKEARPDARVAIFWHIPWPIRKFLHLPLQRELVDGLLGADLIGFPHQSHCKQFSGEVDRALEALTEWDRFAVNPRVTLRACAVSRQRAFPGIHMPSMIAQRRWQSAPLCAPRWY